VSSWQRPRLVLGHHHRILGAIIGTCSRPGSHLDRLRDLREIIIAFVGAVILLLIWRALFGRKK